MIDKNRADGIEPTPAQSWASRGAFIISMVLLLGLFLSALVFDGNITLHPNDPLNPVIKNHMKAVIGLQVAGAVAFALVVFLRQTDGPINVEALGFKFKGASGQVIMWIACFLAIASAIKMCW